MAYKRQRLFVSKKGCFLDSLLRKTHIPPDLVVAEGVPDGESSSHRDFLFLHDVGTTSNQLSSHKITSANIKGLSFYHEIRWNLGYPAIALLLQGGSVEQVETYGDFTSCSAGSLTGKLGSRPYLKKDARSSGACITIYLSIT